GGYMATVDRSKLRAELAKALVGVARGGITGIVTIPSGYAVLKVLDSAPLASSGSDPAQTDRNQALGAQSSILPTPGFAGFAEANFAFSKFPKPDGWEDDLPQICSARTQSVSSVINELETFLKAPNADPASLVQVNAFVSYLHSYRGDASEAIPFREAAYRLVQKSAPDQVPLYEEAMGVAYLHRAGVGLYDKFVFPRPLKPDQVNAQQKADLEKAAGYFLKDLERSPDNLGFQWLLNVTDMLAGTYPAAVPAKYLIPPAAL